MTDDSMYCATCKRGLMRHQTRTSGPVTYLHPLRDGQVDHEPLPIPLVDLPDAQIQCDFCPSFEPIWYYDCTAPKLVTHELSPRVVSDKEVHTGRYGRRLRNASSREAKRWGTRGDARLEQDMGGRWAACEGCAVFIDTDNMYGLISRVVAAMPAKLSKGNRLAPLRADLASLYETFFATKQSKIPIGEQ